MRSDEGSDGALGSASVEPSPVAVAIIEDQRVIRDGLAALVNGTDGFHCSGAWRSIEEAVPLIGRAAPQVLLLDIGLPGASGIEGIPALKAAHPGILIVVLTVFDDDERIFAALCEGAVGYLLKKTPPARLLEAVREVADGGAPMSPSVARRVIELFRDVRPPSQSPNDLTPHEARVLKLLAEGHSYKTAAAELGVSPHAVSFHLRRVYEKLEVHSKSEAVAKALRHRLIR
jgi:DNA-binding NarL/FixJ family response regulator